MLIDIKHILKNSHIFIALLVATILITTLQVSLLSQRYELPNGIVISSVNGINIRFIDFDSRLMQTDSSGIVRERSFIMSELSSTPYPTAVQLNYTNASFPRIVPIDFIYGSYFLQNEVDELNRYIVLSDTLAFKLFQEHDVIGKLVTLDDIEFTVCGVYKQNTDILNKLTSNGYEQIYLSYSNLKDYNNAKIQQLYIKSDDTQFTESLIDQTQLSTNPKIYYDNTTDFRDYKQLIVQSIKISLFILGLNIIAFLAVLFIKQLKRIYLYIKRNYSTKVIIKSVLIGLAYALGSITIYMLIKFDLFIPTHILPMDNIFDIKYYVDEFLKIIQAHNALNLYDPSWTHSMLLLAASGICSIILTAMLIITWWNGVHTIQKLRDYQKE